MKYLSFVLLTGLLFPINVFAQDESPEQLVYSLSSLKESLEPTMKALYRWTSNSPFVAAFLLWFAFFGSREDIKNSPVLSVMFLGYFLKLLTEEEPNDGSKRPAPFVDIHIGPRSSEKDEHDTHRDE